MYLNNIHRRNYCLSTAKMVKRTRHRATLYAHWLSCSRVSSVFGREFSSFGYCWHYMCPYTNSGVKQTTRNLGYYVETQHTSYRMKQVPVSYRTWVVTGSSRQLLVAIHVTFQCDQALPQEQLSPSPDTELRKLSSFRSPERFVGINYCE
jgi:hypothetical protein